MLVEDKLFATLDPTLAAAALPAEREVIITDTVGFIRDLPKDLVAAFRATLEEMDEADLLDPRRRRGRSGARGAHRARSSASSASSS